MSLPVPTIITTEANDENNASSSIVQVTAPSVSPSLAITVDSPAEDSENNVQQPLSPSSRSQLSPAPPGLGEPLLRVPSLASHVSSSALSSDRPFTPSFDSESPIDPHAHPPSPTLTSTSHVSFYEHHNATKLRENNPDIYSGKDSFQLLSPHDGHHMCTPGCATGEGSIAEATEPDHGGLRAAINDLAVEEQIRSASLASSGRKKNGKNRKGKGKGTGDDDGSSSGDSWLEVPDDPESFDPAPFAFKPKDLAVISERRNSEQLEEWGGTAGLLAGLGADSRRGLSSDGVPSSVFVHGQQDTFEHLLSSPSSPTTAVEHSEVPVYLHRRGEFVGSPLGVGDDDGKGQPEYDPGPYAASLDDRRRIYGPNVIPARKSKSLLELMWLALTDRVLVSLLQFSRRYESYTHSWISFVCTCF